MLIWFLSISNAPIEREKELLRERKRKERERESNGEKLRVIIWVQSMANEAAIHITYVDLYNREEITKT